MDSRQIIFLGGTSDMIKMFCEDCEKRELGQCRRADPLACLTAARRTQGIERSGYRLEVGFFHLVPKKEGGGK